MWFHTGKMSNQFMSIQGSLSLLAGMTIKTSKMEVKKL